MAEATLPTETPRAVARANRVSVGAIAWRNLWRNRRRTWLMVGGIAFCGLLVIIVSSMQLGVFEMMIDNSTRFFTGHVQVQHPDYLDEPRMNRTVANARERMAALALRPEFTAIAPRAQAFALLAASGDISADSDTDPPATGGLVIGVDPIREFGAIRHATDSGRYLEEPGEAYVGSMLADNLHVGIGDEVAILGNAGDGGVAAMVVTVAGTFSSGQADIDRSQMLVHLADFQDAFGLDDEVHSIALTLADPKSALAAAATLGDAETAGVPWQELMPDVHQMIDLKLQSTYMIYVLLLVLLTFSIVNAFIMTTFERTPEFGMLKAIGMRPGGIVGMMTVEALWMAVLGIAVTLAIGVPLITILGVTGITLGETYSEMTAQFRIPERLFPSFGYRVFLEFSITVLVATQVAALIPTLRLRRLNVVDALRAEE